LRGRKSAVAEAICRQRDCGNAVLRSDARPDTEDRQWIHVDAERARLKSPYGTTIAHGFLTLSLVSHFIKQAVEIRHGVTRAINYGLNRVRFPAAVRANAKIRARVTLLNVNELPDSVEAIYSVSIETEGATKPSCVAECVIRYYP